MNYRGYEIVVTKKNNKNTYIRVKDDMKVYVSINYFVSKREIKKLIDRNIEFINNMLEKQLKRRNYEEEFYYLGKKYDVQEEQSEENIYKWYKKQANKIFLERLKLMYEKFEEDIPFPKLTIRKMKTRWGVCNRRLKRVTLNLELIKKDYEYVDYVIVHELAHFVYFNHSRDFWNLVGKYVVNFKKLRKELNDYKC